MAAAFTLKLDTSEALRAFDRLEAVAPMAIARALNRSIGSAKTVMVQGISRDLQVKSGSVRDEIHVEQANQNQADQRASLTVSGKPIPLIQFDARGPEPSRGRGRGVSWRLQGQRRRDPRAFIATMRSGHRGVFKRNPGAARLPIHELHGPSLPKVFTKFMPVGLARAEDQLVKNLEHEFAFAMRQAHGG